MNAARDTGAILGGMSDSGRPGGRHIPAGPFDLARISRGLPAAGVLADLAAAFAAHHAPRLVIEAPPGSGKTTVVPPAIADRIPGRVVVTEPRRLAARAAAHRLAELTGTRVGELAGYSVHGERRVDAGTRVEFVTSGLLLRRLLADPELPGVGAVVLDEVHERELDADLAFALVDEVSQLRGDLAIAAMSATLDAERWAALLGADSRVLSVPMRPHPLQVVWNPAPRGVARLDERGVTRAFLAHVAGAAQRALTEQPEGSVLVFLPGRREVETVVGMLRDLGIPALPLHGSMPAAAQDEVLRPGAAAGRRVIVATSVAESSLTVPDVCIVVDAGLAREPRRDARRGLSGLVTVPVSQASAQQRAGRAARLGPGIVVRCYTEQTFAIAPHEPRPEISTADLTGAALTLAAWGDPDGAELALPDPPPAAALADGQRVLIALGALTTDVDGHQRVTDRGRRLARIPAHPRLARALVDGAARIGADRAGRLVAAIGSDARAPGADLAVLWRDLRHGGSPAASRWRQDARRLARLVQDDEPGARSGAALSDDEALGLLTGLAYPERLARLRDRDTSGAPAGTNRPGGAGAGASSAYLLASGTGAALPRGSALQGSRWLAIADVARAHTADASGAIIRAAVPISADAALQAGAALLHDEVTAEWRDDRLRAERVHRLGAIELTRAPAKLDHDEARAHVRRLLADDSETGSPLRILHWSPAAAELRARLALLHRVLGGPWPAVDAAALSQRLDDWLAPEIDQLAAGRRATGIDLAAPLRRLLPWPAATRLDELVPERLEVPSGSLIRVDYPALDAPDAPPVLAVKLQECFGWDAAPRLVDGRVPVQLQLLSPAHRPLAITTDLASFWNHAYPQVRAEMRGRYPKHPWPEDPRSAPAMHGTKRRGR